MFSDHSRERGEKKAARVDRGWGGVVSSAHLWVLMLFEIRVFVNTLSSKPVTAAQAYRWIKRGKSLHTTKHLIEQGEGGEAQFLIIQTLR